jgi:prolyl oligopeptidase
MKKEHFNRCAIYAFLLSVILFSNCQQQQEDVIPAYPSIEGQPITDTYFGTEIVDQYRNLENLKDSATVNWFRQQSEHSNAIFDRISGRDELMQKMANVDGREAYSSWYYYVLEDNQHFFIKDKSGEDTPKLYHRKNFEASDELIFNPKDFKPESGKNYRINYVKPSFDGKYVAVALSFDGQEISEMIVIDVATKRPMPQIITNCWPADGGGVSWLPDNSGFIYLHYPVIDATSDRFLKDMQSVVYKLGQDPKKLNVIFSQKTQPHLNIKEEDFPIVQFKKKDDKYLFAYVGGATAYYDAYYAKISDIGKRKPNWKVLFKKEDKIKQEAFLDDSVLYLSAKNSDHFQLFKGNLKNRTSTENDVILASKENEVLELFALTSDGIYYTSTVNGVQGKLYHLADRKETEIALPVPAGSVGLRTKMALSSDLWVSNSGWLNSYIRYKYDLSSNTFTEQMITKGAEYPEYEHLVVKEVLVKAHDGEEIPLTIIHKKDIEMNGQNPTLFYGYGAYGVSYTPFFVPTFLTWVSEGGILCYTHVRGGGEKGDSWYQGGKKKTKPNTWKDLICSAEYMIDQGYTSKQKTVIRGGSAGGILIGRAMTERPDLFAVAIAEVGVLNPIRSEITPNGPNNIKEFGTMKDSLESQYLIEMDAYHHIQKNTQYPATLVTTGMNDPRVIPWQPGKFAAKLQQDSNSTKPILFKVDFKAGHGLGDSKETVFLNDATIFAFAFWQTGHPDYQLIK